MKKLTAILAATVATAAIANADELSVSATFAWESSYVFRGIQFADITFMPSVDVAYGGFYAGIWAALPVDGSKDGDANEVDFYAGYSMAVSDLVSLDFGLTYYTFPSGPDAELFGLDPNTLEFYVGVAFEMPFSPSVYFFYDVELDLFTVELAAGHAFELGAESSIEVSGFLGYWNESGGLDNIYLGVGAAYVYSFSDNAALSVGVNWYWSDEKLLGRHMDKANRLTYGFSFSAGF